MLVSAKMCGFGQVMGDQRFEDAWRLWELIMYCIKVGGGDFILAVFISDAAISWIRSQSYAFVGSRTCSVRIELRRMKGLLCK